MDVDSIGLGLDFVEVVQDALSSCEVLLALIGTGWVDMATEGGTRRLDDPSDFVRIELETALKRNVRVVPILLNGAPLPEADQLPAVLRAVARRQALELDDATFRSQVRRLIEQLERVLPTSPIGKGAVGLSDSDAERRGRPRPLQREEWIRNIPWTDRLLEVRKATKQLPLVLGGEDVYKVFSVVKHWDQVECGLLAVTSRRLVLVLEGGGPSNHLSWDFDAIEEVSADPPSPEFEALHMSISGQGTLKLSTYNGEAKEAASLIALMAPTTKVTHLQVRLPPTG